MGILRRTNGKYEGHAEGQLISVVLDPFMDRHPPWSKIDCVASLIMLRSCAKSLFETMPEELKDETRKKWIESLQNLLVTDGQKRVVGGKTDDFYLKVHAAVSSVHIPKRVE